MQRGVTPCCATRPMGSSCNSHHHKLSQLAGMFLVILAVLEPSASLLQPLSPHRALSHLSPCASGHAP